MIIWICMLLLYFQQCVDCVIFPSFTKLFLPPNATAPEALAFDARGGGPYTGVGDGRILKYQCPKVGFIEFATTSPLRTKQLCDGNTLATSICGRPGGIAFHYSTGELYIADFGFGFLKAPPNGGLATQLATGFKGTPFGLLNAVDIDQANHIVYFTDFGTIPLTLNITQLVQSGDKTGKLYEFDIRTKQLTLLLSGLSGPAGVAVSKTGAYVLIDEYIATRIRKFWLKGPKANRSEILINLPGSPDNIKRTILGDFWVSETIVTQQAPVQTTSSVGLRINGLGRIEASVNLTPYYKTTDIVSEVQEYSGKLYIGSITTNFVGVYGA